MAPLVCTAVSAKGYESAACASACEFYGNCSVFSKQEERDSDKVH